MSVKAKMSIRLLCAVLISVVIAAALSGCSGNTAKDSGKSVASATGAADQTEYYPGVDYDTLDPSTLDYGDEEIAAGFSYTDGWKTMSPSAQRLSDFSSVVGSWKAVMISDPENKTDKGKFTDYFNVEISGSDESVKVVFNRDKRIIGSTGEELDLRAARSEHYGRFEKGSITAYSTNHLSLTDFWSDNGMEYAVGLYSWSDRTEGYIGLIRESLTE